MKKAKAKAIIDVNSQSRPVQSRPDQSRSTVSPDQFSPDQTSSVQLTPVQQFPYKMTIKMNIDFDKLSLNKTVLDILQNGLPEDPDQTCYKLSYRECLAVIARGKKLQNAPANYLLLGLLKTLYCENSSPEEEFLPGDLPEDDDLGKDPTFSQSLAYTEDSSQEINPDPSTHNQGKPAQHSGPNQNTNTQQKKKKELCRFYARGHCTRKKESDLVNAFDNVRR